MKRFLSGIRRFQQHVFQPQRTFFHQLAQGQQPSTMLITCCDSRIDPTLITQTRPGELFIARNVGNVVPPYGASPIEGMAAAVEYGVVVVRVQCVVVLGHSQCGAAIAALEGGAGALASVRRWLEYMPRPRDEGFDAGADTRQRLQSLIRQNVLDQCRHLQSHPSVRDAVAGRGLEVHASIFEIETGQVLAYDSARQRFVPLAQCVAPNVAAHESAELKALFGA